VVAEAGTWSARLPARPPRRAYSESWEASAVVFEPFEAADLGRVAELVESYAELRLGTVDAAVIATVVRPKARRRVRPRPVAPDRRASLRA